MNESQKILPFVICIFFALFLAKESKSQHFIEISEDANLHVLSNNNGHSIVDYDNDGHLDIFMVGHQSFDYNSPDTWSRLMWNNGQGKFIDVTINAGFSKQFSNPGQPGYMGQKMGASWGDFNNDGLNDLMLTHYRKVQLYKNLGKGKFEDITEQAEIKGCPECYNNSALWWDFDNDGDLDLYISDWKKKNRLLENLGNETFRDISRPIGLDDEGSTWTSIPFDANHDGWLDLYVVNDYSDNRFYINQNGESFVESTEAYGLEDDGDGMGVTIGDFNNDGYFDIYLTNIFFMKPNPLFTGTASGVFVNEAQKYGVSDAGWSWGTQFFDCDNDGDEDLYAANGFIHDTGTNRLFRNMLVEGQDDFVDWSEQSATNGSANAMSMEAFDMDDDGDLDILISNTNSTPYLYRNETNTDRYESPNKWLKIQLVGTTSNRNAFGSKVTLWTNGRAYHRYYHGASLLGQSPKPIHFGLNQIEKIDSLKINWPLGLEETIYEIEPNQTLRLYEGGEVPQVVTSIPTRAKKSIFKVLNIYPNPTSQSSNIEFSANAPGTVQLEIYSTEGQKIFESQLKIYSPGKYEMTWEGTNLQGINNSDGLYFFKLTLGNQIRSGKIVRQGF